METLTSTYTKFAKRILNYLGGTLNYGLFYSSYNDFKLYGLIIRKILMLERTPTTL